ncbi:cryptochrome-interacting basic-helix-loop-helix5 [Striga asiatica]|uniref:Cryptochrome-interacting basic-helix-loop-helix5 n=1 Tax=Striga asiatica TaxID=4170 RepID=A0A5A7QB70_STRAF|nr:cryptochrome-interacting basic-helix-loop-helix5 [Striga asiatica]
MHLPITQFCSQCCFGSGKERGLARTKRGRELAYNFPWIKRWNIPPVGGYSKGLFMPDISMTDSKEDRSSPRTIPSVYLSYNITSGNGRHRVAVLPSSAAMCGQTSAISSIPSHNEQLAAHWQRWEDRKKSDQQDVLREKAKAGQGLIQTTFTPQPAADTYRPISLSGPSSEKAMSQNVHTSSAWSAYGDWLNIESRAMPTPATVTSIL